MAGSTKYGLGVDKVGTPNTGVVATEYGNGRNHTTILTVSQEDALTFADGANIADGYLLYTLPAGAVLTSGASMDMAVTAADSGLAAGATEVGVGTVIASGAVAVLSGTATFEDIVTGQVAASAGVVVPAVVSTALPILAASAHTVHLNVALASTVAAGSDLSVDLAGTVVLNWTLLA